MCLESNDVSSMLASRLLESAVSVASPGSKMLTALFVALYALCASVIAITVTTSTASYLVNTESSYGFTATISRTSCDITSLKFYGTEYQYSGTASHIASGLGTATVSYTTSGQ